MSKPAVKRAQPGLQTVDGRLVIVSGASRSGKTVYTYRRARQLECLFVWDIEDQWSKMQGFKRINSRAALFEICQGPRRKQKIAFVSSGANIKDDFDFFCECVYLYARYTGPCGVVAEELADVTTTAKAPPGWGILLRRGLKRGVWIFAISQRWAEADKTAIGNASEFACFRMATGDDIAYMAKKTRIPAARLEGLKQLEYIHFDTTTGHVEGHKITF